MDELNLQTEFEFIEPAELYSAWLDGDAHAEMTGGAAVSVPEVGTAYTAWDDYITGTHVELEEGKRIVQTWRTTQFEADAPDSNLELVFESNGDEGTILKLRHWDIPAGDGPRYATGWEEHYFEPMRRFFGDDAFEGDDD